MKIITDNAAYVQKNDLAYLSRSEEHIPASIFMKVFGDSIVIIKDINEFWLYQPLFCYGYRTVVLDDSDRHEFVKFSVPEEIEFFENADWMVDYSKVKDLSDEEIMALVREILEERNAIIQQFNSMSSEEREENVSMRICFEQLDFKLYSLRDFLLFKKGYLKFDLPEGVELSDGDAQRGGFGKLIRSMFNKGKKIKGK